MWCTYEIVYTVNNVETSFYNFPLVYETESTNSLTTCYYRNEAQVDNYRIDLFTLVLLFL